MQEFVTNWFQYNSVVILTYFFLCLIIMIIDKIFKGKFVEKFFSICKKDSWLNPITYFKMFSHSLGHADWNHLYNNFVKILLIGPMIEEKYESINLLIMVLITSLLIGLIYKIFNLGRVKGASGVLYMLIILSSFVNMEGGKIPITLALIIIFFVADDIIKFIKREDDNISHIGHLIGAICGVVFGILSINGINFNI